MLRYSPFKKLREKGYEYKFNMEEDFRPGKYRVSLTNENVNSLHDPFSNFLIRASRNEYFTYQCGELQK